MLDIAGTPEIEHRVIPNDKGAGDWQHFSGDALERVFKYLPGRVGNNRRAMSILAASASTTGQLAIFVGSQEAHLLPIKFAQAGNNDGTSRHVDTERQCVGGKDSTQMTTREERLHQHFQTGKQSRVMER